MSDGGKQILADCPTCRGPRQAHVRGEYVQFLSGVEDFHKTARILECGGCQTVFFREDIWCSAWATGYSQDIEEDMEIVYWPSDPKPNSPIVRIRPYWLADAWIHMPQADSTLANLLEETYSATNNGLLILAAIGVRTVVDRSSELLGVDPAKTFADKLVELAKLGKITSGEKDTLDILIEAGNAAAHRGWRPAPSELNTMFEVMEAFIKRVFVSDDIQKLKSAVPPKKREAKT